MPRPRRIDDATLLAAAREVFVAKGAAATTREVARRAGVSEGVIFQRYKTKALTHGSFAQVLISKSPKPP